MPPSFKSLIALHLGFWLAAADIYSAAFSLAVISINQTDMAGSK
jgi:hypothetical protein